MPNDDYSANKKKMLSLNQWIKSYSLTISIYDHISNRAQMHIPFVRQDKEDVLPFQKKGKNRNPFPREGPF
jgi:hypothetical protein